MTQKDELAQAQAKISDLEKELNAKGDLQTQLDQANTNLQAAEADRDKEKNRADKAEADLQAAEADRDKEKGRANELDGKLTDAKQEASDAKASEQKMTEQLAARGIKPVKKAAEVSKNNGKGEEATAEELREQLNACTDPGEKFNLSQKLRKLETAKKD